MPKRKTAGALALGAARDSKVYDYLEVGHDMTQDVFEQLKICAEKHSTIIDEPEFCVVMLLADDILIKGLLRRKFYAWPFLPKPRPRQSVFLYNKHKDKFIRLWTLFNAANMAVCGNMRKVAPNWKQVKGWVDAFYKGVELHDESYFHRYIRKEHGITLPSEKEYLEANREELIKAGCKETKSLPPEPFDFTKIVVNQVVNPDDIVSD